MKNIHLKNQLGVLFILASLLLSSCIKTSQKDAAAPQKEKERRKRLSGADKQLNSWFWEKAYPNPTSLTGKYLKAWQEYQEIKQNNPFIGAHRVEDLGSWTAWGPKVFGGRVLSLAINPTAAASGKRTIFAGSASGGMWKSYSEGDGATAWQPVETGQAVLGVSSIVYHPSDTNILIAGTGEVYRVETLTNGANSTGQVGNIGRNVWKTRGTYGIGILRSTDGGYTWSHAMTKVNADLFGIQVLRFDPTNSNIVYACATDGLYKSIDAGATWSSSPIWSGTYVSDVVIDPANNQNILLAAGNVGNSNKGIWKSTNGGTTFTQVTPGSFPSAAKSGYRGDVKFSIAGSSAPYTLFASIGMNDLGSGYSAENEVYRSTNFGDSWTMISNSNHASYQSWYSHVVTPYPGSTSKLFMAGVGKYVLTISVSTGTRTSIGGGAASSSYLLPGAQEGTNYLHADVHDIKFLPGSSTTAFFATDGGIFKTTNAGASPISNMNFVSCNGGLQIQQFYPTVAQSKSGTTVVGGLQDNNVIRYNGTGWAKVLGGDGGPCMFKPDNENIMLGSNDTRGVYASTNIGASLGTSVLTYLGSISTPYDNRTSFMAPIGVSPANPNRWYVASDNLHVSTFNTGTNTFGTFSNNNVSGIPLTNYIDALHKPAVSIGVSDLNANKLYISTSPFAQDISNDNVHYNPPARIRKSTDGGSTFTTVSSTLPDRFVTDFAISKTNDDSVFVTLSGFGTTHVYVTGDGGNSWSPRGSGLPDVPFNTIMFDPIDARILYAGSDFGVFVSQDRGATWFDFSNGMWDATYVMDLQPAPGNKIRAFTHGKGIFESNLWVYLQTLPVDFISFSGINSGSNNKLTWITAEEFNLARYEVERSTDGTNFQKVHEVNARNSTTESMYSITDFIGNSPAPVYYYRIRSRNQDGTYMFSDVIKIKVNNGNSKIEILGNPFRSSITFRYTVTQTGKLQYSLTDMTGRVYKREEFVVGAGSATYTINSLSGLPSGVYLLNIGIGNKRNTLKVIKQ